jgi:hypothetical protein
LSPSEWEKYNFSEEQQQEILRKKGLVSVPPPAPPPPVVSPSNPADPVEAKIRAPGELAEVKTHVDSKTDVDSKFERDGKIENKSVERKIPENKSVDLVNLNQKPKGAADFWRSVTPIRPPPLPRVEEKGRESALPPVPVLPILPKIPTPPAQVVENRRPVRIRKQPDRLTYAAAAGPTPPKGTPVPKTLGEAKKSPFWEGFNRAIFTELETLEKNGTWVFVERASLPRGTNILRSKIVFDLKFGSTGEFLKYKARMVAMFHPSRGS